MSTKSDPAPQKMVRYKFSRRSIKQIQLCCLFCLA